MSVNSVDVSITVKVICEESGDKGNLADGENMTLLSPIPNVESEATVLDTVIQGEDTETDDSLRARLIAKLQSPPLGGAAADYLAAAKAVPGVTRAWVLPLNQGPGTVDLTFVEDNDDPIVPDPAKIQEVQDAIDAFKPVTAIAEVFAPILAPADMTISITPNVQSVRDAIIAEIEDLILTDAQIPGSYKSASEVHTGKILLSKLRTAIGLASGLSNYEIDLINGNPPADIVPGVGELITLGDITWQAGP